VPHLAPISLWRLVIDPVGHRSLPERGLRIEDGLPQLVSPQLHVAVLVVLPEHLADDLPVVQVEPVVEDAEQHLGAGHGACIVVGAVAAGAPARRLGEDHLKAVLVHRRRPDDQLHQHTRLVSVQQARPLSAGAVDLVEDQLHLAGVAGSLLIQRPRQIGLLRLGVLERHGPGRDGGRHGEV
jgi:hypothetical protein